MIKTRNSLAIKRLGFWASTAGDMGSIPDQRTKILQAAQQKKKKI